MAKTFQDLLNEGQAKVLGIVSIVPMDDWNTDTQYQKLNLVRHNGASYLAKGGSKNVEPGVTQDWQNSWMLVYLDGILSPDGTYPNLTAGRVMHALAWGNKNYDGSSAQTITAADLGLADVYKPQGSIAFASLPATPNESNYGYVWNITNDFTTDSRFIEGAGKKYSAGTNVGVINQDGQYYYDILGNFVDLSNYAKIDGNYQEMTVGQATNAQNAANVTSQINGHAISDIFETDGTTVKEATQLSDPFTVGVDTSTATTGFVKFATVSLPQGYCVGTARFEILDKNYVNTQSYPCGVEVSVRNTDANNVIVQAVLLYGNNYYLSKIYACAKTGSYPITIDFYIDITSANPQNTVARIKPLFTYFRASNTQFTFITDNEVVANLPTNTTNTQLSTIYMAVTEALNLALSAAVGSSAQPVYFNANGVPVACGDELDVSVTGNAGGFNTFGLTKKDDLNTYNTSAYWGTNFHWGHNNNPANSPVGANGGNLQIFRTDASGVAQICTSSVSTNGTDKPTTWQRDYNNGIWSAWEEIVTADGSYPTLGAGYLAKQHSLRRSTNTAGWLKIGTVPNSTFNPYVDYSCIMLIHGIFRGSSASAQAPKTAIIEIEIRKYPTSIGDQRVGVIAGDIPVSNLCSVIEDNLDMSIYLYDNYTENVNYLCEIISEYASPTGTTDAARYDVFEWGDSPAVALTSTPANAVYAVNRNQADYNSAGAALVDVASAQQISGAKTFTEVIKAASPATGSNSDDIATTEWVNDKIDDIDVPAVPNLNGSTSYSGTYYAAKSLPGNGTFLVGTGTTSSPISGVNLNSSSGFTEADYISFGSATSGNGTLGSYTSHAYLGIQWTKTNSSGEQYVTAYWIPTALLINGSADAYFCVTDSNDFVNFWFSSTTRFNYVSSKISNMRVSLYDYNT